MNLKLTTETYEVVSKHTHRTETLISTDNHCAGLRVWHHSPFCPGSRNAIISEFVDTSLRGRGVERTLLKKAIAIFGKDSLACQFQNKEFVDAGYKLGFRTEDNASISETLSRLKSATSVFMVYTSKPVKTVVKTAKKQ